MQQFFVVILKTWAPIVMLQVEFMIHFFKTRRLKRADVFKNKKIVNMYSKCMWVIPPGWGTICDGVNCYICKCTIYYPWL